jgi:hypothetical protein
MTSRPCPQLYAVMTRRRLLQGAAAGAALMCPAWALTSRRVEAAAPPAPLKWRGINYDVGTNYNAGYPAPSSLSTRGYDVEGLIGRDIGVITTELHCNSLQIYGTPIDLLRLGAEHALEHGLEVWIQPRLIDASPADRLDHMVEAARLAEELREQYEQVRFNVGVELSLFMAGVVPGATWSERIGPLFSEFPVPPEIGHKLNDHLADAYRMAAGEFGGDVTYSAGGWEDVAWDQTFDIVGLDVYVRPIDRTAIVDFVRPFQRYGKPVVATEFGCVTHADGDETFGADVVDWTASPAAIVGDPTRSESTQASAIEEQLGVFREVQLDGAFLFVFMEPAYVHADDAAHDLDMGSFGIVKPVPIDGSDGHVDWEPKEAFDRVAALYGAP